MHQESLDEMRRQLCELMPKDARIVLDVGSADINGTYRQLIPDGIKYIGADIADGKNVDIIMQPNRIPLSDGSVDVVLCGQVLEHCYDPMGLMREIARVLRSGGRAFIVAPAQWPKHRYPVDCFRILEDGMRGLLSLSGLKVLACYEKAVGAGVDTWGVGEKI